MITSYESDALFGGEVVNFHAQIIGPSNEFTLNMGWTVKNFAMTVGTTFPRKILNNGEPCEPPMRSGSVRNIFVDDLVDVVVVNVILILFFVA